MIIACVGFVVIINRGRKYKNETTIAKQRQISFVNLTFSLEERLGLIGQAPILAVWGWHEDNLSGCEKKRCR